MSGRTQFSNVDPATAGDMLRKGLDPLKLDQSMERMLLYTYANLPDFPVANGCRTRPGRAGSDPGGVDRISCLPPLLLRNIVSRLPAKDAARTAVLSTRWRTVWRSTPLLLSDRHLLPKGHIWPLTPANSPAITAAVSRILEAHQGPFQCVHLVCTNMSSYRPQLARWLQLLAGKGVQDLVLINRPWPRDMPLPPTVFTISTLTRLYVGVWKLPHTAVLRGASFPHLRELGLCCVQMEHGDADALVARSPVLAILNILGCLRGLRLRLVSQSLRCVQILGSIVENIAVVKAPCLQRLIMYAPTTEGLCTRVRIGDAPKLRVFGYLEPGQVLEIRETVIMPGVRTSTSTMLTSVKILALKVCFGVRSDVNMVPTFLRCFPNAERLHIMSTKCDQPAVNLTLQFWEESGPIENVTSRISMMSIREFTGEPGEVGFLEYFFRTAQVVRTVVVAMANPDFTPFSKDEVCSKVRKCGKHTASNPCYTHILQNTGRAGGEMWNFKEGADFSFLDPFSVLEVVASSA